MSVHWELTTVIKCVTTPLALTIAAVILASIFSTIHTSALVLYLTIYMKVQLVRVSMNCYCCLSVAVYLLRHKEARHSCNVLYTCRAMQQLKILHSTEALRTFRQLRIIIAKNRKTEVVMQSYNNN